jgi:hypothetical protein
MGSLFLSEFIDSCGDCQTVCGEGGPPEGQCCPSPPVCIKTFGRFSIAFRKNPVINKFSLTMAVEIYIF